MVANRAAEDAGARGWPAGPLCDGGDRLVGDDGTEWRHLPTTTGVGDVVAFGNTGAYTLEMMQPCNAQPRAAAYAVDRGEVVEIRRRESDDDMVARIDVGWGPGSGGASNQTPAPTGPAGRAGRRVTGAKSGVASFWDLAKVMLPAFLGAIILQRVGAIGALARVAAPVMHLLGLPGSAAVPLLVAWVLNLYAAIGAMAPSGPHAARDQGAGAGHAHRSQPDRGGRRDPEGRGDERRRYFGVLRAGHGGAAGGRHRQPAHALAVVRDWVGTMTACGAAADGGPHEGRAAGDSPGAVADERRG